ncbi:hypothetical protein EVAR_46278_1 [Eumeta japonica]|uniref:Tectonin beta-propeller repeat-containing protein n=1 Tax=Eumeta variegata TaxID=151549 RepID=A0A4C1Y2A5_EUMVA|nr:hypothetical protein EVAR_46278_1 [Eumeta japonica]
MNEEKEVLEESETIPEEEYEFTTKARWVIPHSLDNITFVGKDVLAVACDVYIMFFNFKTNTETVYVANNEVNGDGVDLIAVAINIVLRVAMTVAASERSYNKAQIDEDVLAIASGPRQIQGGMYDGMRPDCGFQWIPKLHNNNMELEVEPTSRLFKHRSRIQKTDLPRGSAVAKECTNSMEMSWLDNVLSELQSEWFNMTASCTQTSVCECWSEGLIVWEVGQVYHKTFLIKRAKEVKSSWDLKEPTLIDVCWTNDGQLFAIDSTANLYNVSCDGIWVRLNLEWSEKTTGKYIPKICGFMNGILLAGTDRKLKTLKKYDKSWKVVWEHKMDNPVERLVPSTSRDAAAVWTDAGHVYRITAESEEKVSMKLFTFKQRSRLIIII